MIEPIMYFGIGFLVAALLGLLFVPLVHNRAVRLTRQRLEAATPLSIAEIRADKDQLRAEFAMSTRRLEINVDQMKNKTTTQLAELGKKSDAINQLKKELGDKTATIFNLESRDKTLRDQLRATEEEFELKSASLREAERTLSDKEAELAKLLAELGERSITADSQRVELAALRTQVEAMKVSVTDYEHSAAAFTPPPKVTSSVVELIPRARPEPCDPATLSALTQAAFGQRRKMLRQSLKAFAAARGLDVAALLAAAGLEPTMRAEEVDVEGFAALARAVAGPAR